MARNRVKKWSPIFWKKKEAKKADQKEIKDITDMEDIADMEDINDINDMEGIKDMEDITGMEDIKDMEDITGMRDQKKESAEKRIEETEKGMDSEPKGKVSLDSLEPADVFGYFKKIAAIPHGSFHTEAISDYLESFAKERKLDYIRDEAGNLIISRPGSAGYEDAEPLALQGHIDMVCEKEDSLDLDMETQPISLMTDGKWLTADRTTLGGDDGIAVAIMLAILDDSSIKCPPLECIFTTNEEVGLLGAAAIDLSPLKSRRLINIDSEEEGYITVSCAGGAEVICSLSADRKEREGFPVTLEVSGLAGGHSGEKISEGRANAVLLLARLLYRLRKEGKYRICSLEGGKKDNAIPRTARAQLLFTKKASRRSLLEAVRTFTEEVKTEFHTTDPDMKIEAVWLGKENGRKYPAFSRKDSMRIVRFLMAIPNGVIEYVPEKRDIPRTSLSLGIAETTEEGFRTHSLVRSSLNSRKQMMIDRLTGLAEIVDASVGIRGAYPAWELKEESEFRDMAVEVYRKVTGRQAKVIFIHAGLECGLLADKVEGLDCISIGPDMEDIHTPGERLNIASSARTYEYIRAMLAECAERDANKSQGG